MTFNLMFNNLNLKVSCCAQEWTKLNQLFSTLSVWDIKNFKLRLRCLFCVPTLIPNLSYIVLHFHPWFSINPIFIKSRNRSTCRSHRFIEQKTLNGGRKNKEANFWNYGNSWKNHQLSKSEKSTFFEEWIFYNYEQSMLIESNHRIKTKICQIRW